MDDHSTADLSLAGLGADHRQIAEGVWKVGRSVPDYPQPGLSSISRRVRRLLESQPVINLAR